MQNTEILIFEIPEESKRKIESKVVLVTDVICLWAVVPGIRESDT